MMAVELSKESAKELSRNPNIEYISPSIIYRPMAQTMDWGYTATGVNTYYRGKYTGNGVKVANINSGMAYHSDLPIIGAGHYFDAVQGIETTWPGTDPSGHGTFIAGIFAAQDNSIGVVGVAPGVDLYIADAHDDTDAITSVYLIEVIQWAIEKDIDIINFSNATLKRDLAVLDVLRDAYDNEGILIVAAAGNEGTGKVDWPARDYSCIAVGSIDSQYKLASTSNHGEGLEIVAPGVNVYSTNNSNGYKTWSGTSFAAPNVVGHLAILKEIYPTYSPQRLRTLLTNNAMNCVDVHNYANGLAYALDNVFSPVQIREEFDDTDYAFSFTGNWDRAEETRLFYPGAYTYRSADISDNESTFTEFSVDIPVGATNAKVLINFRTETEANHDLFQIYVNGNLEHTASGNSGFLNYFEKALSPGTHTIELEYVKDGSLAIGDDSVYIEYIKVFYCDIDTTQIIEDFEDTSYDYTIYTDWDRTTDKSVSGSYSFRSKVIGNNQYSHVDFSMPSVPNRGRFSFNYYVSSESGHDKMEVSMFNNGPPLEPLVLLEDSGETGWKTFSHDFEAGRLELLIKYIKDGSGSAGSDAVYIDDVKVEYFD